jgi:putative isomerase
MNFAVQKCIVCCILCALPRCGAAGWRISQNAAPVAETPATEWCKRQSRHLSPSDADLLRRAQSTLLDNIVSLPVWGSYRGVEPSRSTYRGIWNWDSAFHAIAISHWDPQLAREQFNIVFDRQLANGALPDVIWEDGAAVTTLTKPPVMAWAIAVVDRRSPDVNYLRKVYPKLVRLGRFWLTERGGNADGLFYYAGSDAGEDSGWDNSIRWDNGYRKPKDDSHRLWAIDLNCYMLMHYRAMAYIASRLHLPADEREWMRASDRLAKRINAALWDDRIGFYVDRDRRTGAEGAALSPAGFMPLFAHIAPPERAARVARLAADRTKFFPGMPTAAYDTPGYESSGYWRGSTWLNVAFFALKGLHDYGFTRISDPMRSRMLRNVERDPTTIWEYYDSRSGRGAGARDFGWSAAFTICLILDWENDSLTWLLQ